MKKILLFALFIVSNAMAMSPRDLIELSKQDNPPEAQLRAVFNQGIIDFGKAVAFESVRVSLRENPSAFCAQIDIKKTREKIENALYTAKDKVKDWQIAEMNTISRNVSASEEIAVCKLLQILDMPTPYSWRPFMDHARIVDADSYINGLFLKRERKNDLLSCLNSDFDVDVENKRPFLSLTKSQLALISHLMDKSRTYKMLMVSFLAKNEAKLPLSSRYAYKDESGNPILESENRGATIFAGHKSQKKANVIEYNVNGERSYFRTLFASCYSGDIMPDMTYSFLSNPEFDLFHEVGHYLDHRDNGDFLDKKVSGFLSHVPASRFTPLEFLKKKLNLSKEKEVYYLDYLAERHFDSAAEIWQILGLNLLANSKGEMTLYINKMSDFALYCELGMPIRLDHTAHNRENLIILHNFKDITEEEKYKFPLEAYGALMEIHGYSLGGYILRLMYPYGLYSLLQNEYKLNLMLKKRVK